MKNKMSLQANSLSKSYGSKVVVNDVSINVKQGEIVGLLGPNGAGKTTTFYSIVGLIKPDEGSVYLGGKDITSLPMFQRARNGIGYLAQEASVFRNLSVRDNILAVLEHHGSKYIILQIGNPLIINYKTKIDVISNFRELDVLMGGQGAPLVPYGDKELFGEYDYCINIGGIANVSKLYSNELTAYDICPANIVLNKYAKKKGLPFDKNGELASNGNKINSLLEKLNQLNYYELKGPKSLDISYIEKKFFPILTGYSSEDVLNTFTNHIAYQINKSINKEKSKAAVSGLHSFATHQAQVSI